MNYYRKNIRSKRSFWYRLRQPRVLLPVSALAILLVATIIWAMHPAGLLDQSPHHKKNPTGNTTIPENKSTNASPSTPKSSATPQISSTGSAGSTKATSGTTADPNTPLKQPFGEFVSSHEAYVPRDAQRSSTCNTTPGATCVISFTMGSQTVSLPAKVTNADGTAAWEWKASDAAVNLTSGSWTVKATATLGTQTLTSTDTKALVIE